MKYGNILNNYEIFLFIFLQDEFEHTLTKLILLYCIKRQSDKLTNSKSLLRNLKLLDEIDTTYDEIEVEKI